MILLSYHTELNNMTKDTIILVSSIDTSHHNRCLESQHIFAMDGGCRMKLLWVGREGDVTMDGEGRVTLLCVIV